MPPGNAIVIAIYYHASTDARIDGVTQVAYNRYRQTGGDISSLTSIYQQIIDDPMNADMKPRGYVPVYTASEKSKILIVGQAPGRKAQDSRKPWNDISGTLLRQWLGMGDDEFYNPDLVALMPMDFFYPGKGLHGDLPPRKGFAEKWHPELLRHMPDVQLTILIGAYSQKYYLGKNIKKNLTETVRAHEEYLPMYLPLVHPSPLNFRWRVKNPWFETDVLPVASKLVREIIDS